MKAAWITVFVAIATISVVGQQQEEIISPVRLPEERMTSGSIVVSYMDDNLTVSVQGASLEAVLRSVARKLGADLEAPSGASERVIGVWGPASVRDVLTSLLYGSEFNYILRFAEYDHNSPTQIILLPKSPDKTRMSPPQVAEDWTRPSLKQGSLVATKAGTEPSTTASPKNPSELAVENASRMARFRRQLMANRKPVRPACVAESNCQP